MATTIKTVMTYPLDGSTTDFNIPFEYLARKFVRVTLIGVDRKELILNQDYRFATKTTISTTRALGPADGYNMIEIRRFTSATDRLVDFTDGSILRAYDLNISQVQTLHVAEEARDLTADTIGVNNDGNLDARGRRIVNLADGVDDGDAISVGQVKRMNQNSWQARNEAQGFRNETETFRNQAEGFKNESGTNAANTKRWRDETKGFRDEAEQFKNTAGQYATSAGNYATAAHQSEISAENSAAASANSATLAEQQADRAEREADKLGNWNALADTVQGVTDGDVSWYGAHTAKEFRAFGPDGFRLFNGDYGAFFRNDGTNLYLLLTDKGSPLGGFNSLRPFYVNLSNGIPSFPQGGVFSDAVTVYRKYGPQLVVDGLTNQPSYILGQTDNRNSWFVGKGNAGSADVILHSYDLDTSIVLRGDHIELTKPLNVKGEVRTLNSALQNNGDIRGGMWGGGTLSATIHRNRVQYQNVFTGSWGLGQTVTFTDAPISQQFLVVGIRMPNGEVDYVSVCTPSGGANFWINIGQWSYKINTSTDGWRATMSVAQSTSPTAPVPITEVYVVRTALG